jgi:hypothetical protein
MLCDVPTEGEFDLELYHLFGFAFRTADKEVEQAQDANRENSALYLLVALMRLLDDRGSVNYFGCLPMDWLTQ